MKRIVIGFLVLSCFLFARTRSESWKIFNITITSDKQITVPYLNSGLKINALGCSVNMVTPSPNGTYNILVNTKEDFYPLNFVAGTKVTLNAVISASTVQYIWYNNKE